MTVVDLIHCRPPAKCGLAACNSISPIEWFKCRECDHVMCELHFKAPHHGCMVFKSVIARKHRLRAEYYALSSKVAQVAPGQAYALRQTRVKSVKLPVTTPHMRNDPGDWKDGGLNLHIPITFVDNVHWMIRVKHGCDLFTREWCRLLLKSEYATIKALRTVAPEFILDAWMPQPDDDVVYCFVEALDETATDLEDYRYVTVGEEDASESANGDKEVAMSSSKADTLVLAKAPESNNPEVKSTDGEMAPPETNNDPITKKPKRIIGRKEWVWHEHSDIAIKDIAAFLCKLATLKFEGVGSLEPCDSPPGYKVGPLLHFRSQTYPMGPFRTSQEAWLAMLDERLLKIEERTVFGPQSRIVGYLALLEMRSLVAGCKEMGMEGQPTYITHGDNKADIFQVRKDGSLNAVIDWEFAYTSPMAEAFSDYCMGDESDPEQQLLEEELTKLGRSDIIAAMRNGHKYRVLNAAVQDIDFLPDILNYNRLWRLRRYFLGDEACPETEPQSETEWCQGAKERFADHPGLAKVVEIESHLPERQKRFRPKKKRVA